MIVPRGSDVLVGLIESFGFRSLFSFITALILKHWRRLRRPQCRLASYRNSMKKMNQFLLTLLLFGAFTTCQGKPINDSALIGTWISTTILNENIKMERVLSIFLNKTWQNGNKIHLEKETKFILEVGTFEVEESSLLFKTTKSQLEFDPTEIIKMDVEILNENEIKLGEETYTLLNKEPKNLLKTTKSNQTGDDFSE